MSANPITEKWHSVSPILGLPAMDRVEDDDPDVYPAERVYDHLMIRAEAKAARGDHQGTALLVILPASVEYGDWVHVDPKTGIAAKVAGTALVGPFGVVMTPNDTAGNRRGWILVRGKITAKVHTTVAAGDKLGTLASQPGIAVDATDASAIALPGARAESNRATTNTPVSGLALPDLAPGFAEVSLEG